MQLQAIMINEYSDQASQVFKPTNMLQHINFIGRCDGPFLMDCTCASAKSVISFVAASICMLVLPLLLRSCASCPSPAQCGNALFLSNVLCGSRCRVMCLMQFLSCTLLGASTVQHISFPRGPHMSSVVRAPLMATLAAQPNTSANSGAQEGISTLTGSRAERHNKPVTRTIALLDPGSHHDCLLKLHLSYSGPQLAVSLFPLQELFVGACPLPVSKCATKSDLSNASQWQRCICTEMSNNCLPVQLFAIW